MAKRKRKYYTKNYRKDSMTKVFWRNPRRATSLMNAVYFDGKQVIQKDQVVVYDTDEASLILNRDQLLAINRNRDVSKKVSIDGMQILLDIENQSTVDYTMPERILLYDGCSYNNQIHKGMSKEELQNLMPVLTIVIYYGEEKWNGPKNLSEMLKIPEQIRPLINDWKMKLVDIKDIDPLKISDDETRSFVEGIQNFYKWDGEKLSDLVDMKNLTLESAATIAEIVGNREFIEEFKESREEKIGMCTSFNKYVTKKVNEGKNQGISEGMALGKTQGMAEGMALGKTQGITEGKAQGELIGMSMTMIQMLSNKLGELSQEVKEMIQRSSKETLMVLMNQYDHIHLEKDIVKVIQV